MKPIEERFKTIQELSSQLSGEMKEVGVQMKDVQDELKHLDEQLRDLKHTISFFKTNASESSRLTKKMEEIRKQRRILKNALSLYEEVEDVLKQSSTQLHTLEKEIHEKTTKRPVYNHRSSEIKSFVDGIYKAEERSATSYGDSSLLRKENAPLTQPGVLELKKPAYLLSHEKNGKRTTWKLKNTFTNVTVFDGVKLASLLKMLKMFDCKNLQFADGTKSPFKVAMTSTQNMEMIDEDIHDITQYYLKKLNII